MHKLLLVTILLFIPQLSLAANTANDLHGANNSTNADRTASGERQDAPEIITGNFDILRQTASARVAGIIDAQTVLLKDGRIVRLLGLAFPSAMTSEVPEIIFTAKERLEKLLPEGTEILVYQRRHQTPDARRGHVNRMGHLLAHIVRKDNSQWINGTIVAEGLAWVMTDSANHELANPLYALEQSTRNGKKTIWSDESIYGLLTPDTARSGDGQFRVIEGIVKKSATSKNNLYLNFGKDWRSDFTVMISPSLRRSLSRQGIDPMSLSGKTIRVRGWVRSWNGPFMELETPERLEIVAVSRPSTKEPTEASTDAVKNAAPARQTGQGNP